jgi:hypothetical protein
VYPASAPNGFSTHAVVDWNGDGALDLLVGSTALHGASGIFYHPNINGVIFPSHSGQLNVSAAEVTAADWDGDGRPDLATGSTSGGIAVYDNDAFFTPSPRWYEGLGGSGAPLLRWVDHTSDGEPDLSVFGVGQSSQGIYPFQLVQGQAGLGPPIPPPPLGGSDRVTEQAWANFDDDGDFDLALCLEPPASPNGLSLLQFWENNGVGWQQVGGNHYFQTAYCRGLAWADYDGDGDYDLAVALDGDASRLYLNLGASHPGRFAEDCLLNGDAAASGLAWGDWDADGLPDLVLATLGLGNPVPGVPVTGALVFDNAAVRDCEAGEPVPNYPGLGDDLVDITLADIDGDALLELVAVPTGEGQAALIVDSEVLLPFPNSAPLPSGQVGQALALAWGTTRAAGDDDDSAGPDTNDDPIEVLAVLAADNQLYVFGTSADGLSLLSSHSLNDFLDEPMVPTDLAVADWDNDGLLDFLVTTDSAGGDWLFQGKEDLGLDDVWQSSTSETSDLAWVDLDLDGDLDLLRIDPSQGILLNENSLANFHPTLSPPDGAPEFPFLGEDVLLLARAGLERLALRDFDQDGDADIAVCGPGYLAVYETLTTPVAPNIPAQLGAPLWETNPEMDCTDLHWEDLDGDDQADLILTGVDAPAAVWAGTISSSAFLQASASWESGTAQTRNAIATTDLNGDGYLDLAFSLAATDSPAVQVLGSRGGIPASGFEVLLTASGGPITFGDVDRDGDQDLIFGANGGDANKLFYTLKNASAPLPFYVQNPTSAILSAAAINGGFSTATRLLGDAVELSVELRDAESDPVFDYRVEYSTLGSRWREATLVDPEPSLLSSPDGEITALTWDASADGLLDDALVRDGISIRFVIIRQVHRTIQGGPLWGAMASNTLRVGIAVCVPFNADGDAWHCSKDCDDSDPTVYFGAPELCDGLDNDCTESVFWAADEENDDDLDGFSECEGDCDDEDDTVYPGAEELCDRLDNDCDTQVPDVETDDDGDGLSECEGDCDDTNAAVNPSATEVPDDGVDQDCDGDYATLCFYDGDQDGYGGAEVVIAAGGDCGEIGATSTFEDCNDDDATINPGAEESCGNGDDKDCDGSEAEVGVDPDCWPQSCSGCTTSAPSPGRLDPRLAGLALTALLLGFRRSRR